MNIPKKLFLDLGHHYGQGFREFQEKLGIDKTWECHTWEPNPYTRRNWENTLDNGASLIYKNTLVQVHTEAVWDRETIAVMKIEDNNGARDGWGSTLCHNDPRLKFSENVEVQCINFAAWLDRRQEYGAEWNIYIKMDIEGAEFEVLRKMLSIEGLLERVNCMWVEPHERFLPNEDAETREALFYEVGKHTEIKLHW